jgi:aspartate-semialdehyde dehydrogenase
MKHGKMKVGILGATGMVGQRFVQLLEGHPWFELTELAASERSAGKPYGEVCDWIVSPDMPATAPGMEVKLCEPGLDCELVFSALPSGTAREVEEAFAQAGYAVSSNSADHRMDGDVPLLIPEVNPEHLEAILRQRVGRGWERGFIVTNPNCSTIHLVLALKPLQERFGLERVLVTTLQAVSGAGYPGVPSLAIVENVIPYIGQEEEKVQTEPLKLLGELGEGGFAFADFALSAHCNRVASLDGHLECVSVGFSEVPSLAELAAALVEFRAEPQELGLPSAPEHPIVVRTEPDRPQPRRDREAQGGMASVVGRIRECNVLDYRFVVLGHNTIRGAAGCAILNAELLMAKGYLGD